MVGTLFGIAIALASVHASTLDVRPAGFPQEAWLEALETLPQEHVVLVSAAKAFPIPPGGCPLHPPEGAPDDLDALLAAISPPRCGLVVAVDLDPHPVCVSLLYYQLVPSERGWAIASQTRGNQCGCA